jgi:hypothetical protein
MSSHMFEPSRPVEVNFYQGNSEDSHGSGYHLGRFVRTVF